MSLVKGLSSDDENLISEIRCKASKVIETAEELVVSIEGSFAPDELAETLNELEDYIKSLRESFKVDDWKLSESGTWTFDDEANKSELDQLSDFLDAGGIIPLHGAPKFPCSLCGGDRRIDIKQLLPRFSSRLATVPQLMIVPAPISRVFATYSINVGKSKL